jgi:hypothetical protein
VKTLLQSTAIAMVCWGLLSSCKTMSRKTTRVKHKASSTAAEQFQLAENAVPSNAAKSQEVALNASVTSVEPALNQHSETAVLTLESTKPEPTTRSLPEAQSAAQRGPLNFVKVCEALKGKNFTQRAVNHQVRWLCDLGGFAALQVAGAQSSNAGNIREYFEEYNQTMYYGGSLSSTGSLAKASSIGKDFCGSYKGVRALMEAEDNKGPVSKKHPVTAVLGGLNAGEESSALSNGQCEYFQEANPAWGHRFDLLATKNYGKLAGQESGRNVYWQVDAMVAPLNYSSLRQYSSLVLFWEVEGQIKGVVLTRARYSVEGSILGVTRAKLKSNVAAMVGGYAEAVK